jgi:hypothetical protein
MSLCVGDDTINRSRYLSLSLARIGMVKRSHILRRHQWSITLHKEILSRSQGLLLVLEEPRSEAPRASLYNVARRSATRDGPMANPIGEHPRAGELLTPQASGTVH